jgi:hypothetical protein
VVLELALTEFKKKHWFSYDVNSGLVWKHHEAVGAAIYKVCFITSKLHFCG